MVSSQGLFSNHFCMVNLTKLALSIINSSTNSRSFYIFCVQLYYKEHPIFVTKYLECIRPYMVERKPKNVCLQNKILLKIQFVFWPHLICSVCVPPKNECLIPHQMLCVPCLFILTKTKNKHKETIISVSSKHKSYESKIQICVVLPTQPPQMSGKISPNPPPLPEWSHFWAPSKINIRVHRGQV